MRTAYVTTLASILLLAGCVGSAPVDTAATDAPDATAPATAALTTMPLSLEGSTFTGLAACPAPGSCVGQTLPQTQGAGPSWFEVDLDGTLEEVELTLTWSAATPATTELLLGIAYEKDGETDWVYTRGSSPLVLSEKGLAIPAKDVLAVYVNAYKCIGAALCASLEQPFVLEGTLATTSAQG